MHTTAKVLPSVARSGLLETVRPTPAPENQKEHRSSPDEIAALAYSYWQARGCPFGTSEEDWFMAERALGT